MGRLLRPVDIASLVVFRVAFGVLMLIAVGRYFAHGWIDQFFIEPIFFFPYDGFSWVVPWPGKWMYVHFAVLGVLALGIALGAFYRVSTALFCLGFTYVHLIDKTNYLNHYYLVSLLSFLMIFLPAHRAGSVDALRRPSLRAAWTPEWAVWILRFQLGVVYFFGGVAKLNADWLLRAEPLRIWLGANADLPLVGALFERAWVAYAFSYAGLAFDLTVAFLLVWQRTRVAAYVSVVVFHLLTALLFPIGMFPWIMVALTPIFFAPDWPRRLWRGWSSGVAPMLPPPPRPVASSTRTRFGLAFVTIYVFLQLTLPLRHLFYPGDLAWSEEGFRFAWRIMVMEKYAQASFRVTDPLRARTWTVSPLNELTPLQARMMSTQPDMILSFAHHLANQFVARGEGVVEVRADVFASLNGRPNRRLIDEEIDLARQRDGLTPKPWILPSAGAH